MNEGDIKQFNGEWFMFIDGYNECDCGKEVEYSGWYNIDDAVKKIINIGQKTLKEVSQ